jgi:hypothetical protein
MQLLYQSGQVGKTYVHRVPSVEVTTPSVVLLTRGDGLLTSGTGAASIDHSIYNSTGQAGQAGRPGLLATGGPFGNPCRDWNGISNSYYGYFPTASANIPLGISNAQCIAAHNWSSSTWTIEAWVYVTDSIAKRRCGVLGKWQDGSTSRVYSLELDASDHLVFRFCTPSIVDKVITGGIVPPNQWVHLAVSSDGTHVRTFINGAIDSVLLDPGFMNPSSLIRIFVGTNQLLGARLETFRGKISEMRMLKGVCLYSESFSVPTDIFPAV